jgi:hypothetical protein
MAGIVGSSFAGCTADFPAGRDLNIDTLNESKKGNEWVLNVTIETQSTVDSNPGFHNVSVMAYSREEKLTCSKEVGNLVPEGMATEKRITLNCTDRPYIVALSANESPCDEETRIMYMVYNSTSDMWDYHYRDCGQSIP